MTTESESAKFLHAALEALFMARNSLPDLKSAVVAVRLNHEVQWTPVLKSDTVYLAFGANKDPVILYLGLGKKLFNLEVGM